MTLDRLPRLAQYADAFEAPGFRFGEWVPPEPIEGGVIRVGWYSLSPRAESFIRDAYDAGWVFPFDWGAWAKSARGKELIGHPEAVAEASVDDLARLLTVYVRADRFADGTLADAFESGMLTAILRRARDLTDDRT